MMKKFFIVLAAAIPAAAVVFCLAGCGRGGYITAQAQAQELDVGDDGRISDGTGKKSDKSGGVLAASDTDVKDDGQAEPKTGQEMIFVQITGQVLKPGVYEVPAGARLYELVKLAGGFLADAASDDINQVAVLSDGQLVKIPTEEEFVLQQQVIAEEEAGLIDLNSASKADLCTLPGIGEGKAAAIIAYREENGGFSSKEDLMKVSGIGESTYKKLEEFITAR